MSNQVSIPVLSREYLATEDSNILFNSTILSLSSVSSSSSSSDSGKSPNRHGGRQVTNFFMYVLILSDFGHISSKSSSKLKKKKNRKLLQTHNGLFFLANYFNQS